METVGISPRTISSIVCHQKLELMEIPARRIIGQFIRQKRESKFTREKYGTDELPNTCGNIYHDPG